MLAEAEIEANRDQLAALTVPSALNTAQREAVAREVDESFVSGFRVVMIVSAVMAFASAGAAAISIGARREGSARTVTANGAPDRDSTAVRTRVSQR